MSKWHLIIDIEKCEDCNNCFLSCKDEHVDNDWPPIAMSQPRHGHRWINIMRKERGEYPLIDVAYRPTPCMHCDNAPCIEKAADGAIYQRDDGIVIIDPQKARGQKDLVKACPYGAIWWNEDNSLPQKCTLCAHLLDQGWQKTRCTQVCPTGALELVKADEAQFRQRIETEKLEVLHPEYGSRPRVYYRNLYRYNSCFIAGSVAVEKDGVMDCAQGAQVVLNRGGQQLASAMADAFGDFKFDDLASKSGAYQLSIEFEGYQTVTMNVELADSVSLPDIVLTA
jgi:Fe-S-cluster-containing dehydrogenase component